MTPREWDSAAYDKQRTVCRKLTAKGIQVALNQAHAMTPEALEAYLDTLRELDPAMGERYALELTLGQSKRGHNV